MGTIFTRRFEADRIGSQVPLKLMHLEGLYELFVSKFVSSCPKLFNLKFGQFLLYFYDVATIPFLIRYIPFVHCSSIICSL